MFNWWLDQHWRVRCAISLAILFGSSAVWLSGGIRSGSWGIGLGLSMFVFSFPSSSERKGYHD